MYTYLKMNKTAIITILLVVGLFLLAAGTVLPLFAGLQFATFRIIYASGAAMVLISRLFSPYRGDNLRLKRLHRLEFWSAILYCAAAFFLFYPGGTFQQALAFTLAGAAVQIYASVMVSIVSKQEADKQ